MRNELEGYVMGGMSNNKNMHWFNVSNTITWNHSMMQIAMTIFFYPNKNKVTNRDFLNLHNKEKLKLH